MTFGRTLSRSLVRQSSKQMIPGTSLRGTHISQDGVLNEGHSATHASFAVGMISGKLAIFDRVFSMRCRYSVRFLRASIDYSGVAPPPAGTGRVIHGTTTHPVKGTILWCVAKWKICVA